MSGLQPLSSNSRFAFGIAAIAFMALVAAFAIRQLRPTVATTSDAPAAEFSSGRALAHVKAIAGRPRAMGTAEHSAARDYILNQLTAAGLAPEVQRTTAVQQMENGNVRAGTVENIAARLKGTSNTRAILLLSHYDSVPTSFGASDDASGVAVLLETLRALKSGAALNNDVIFLFTDGEEVALLGAQAFVAEHPWAKDVGLVLNFEARGAGGPSIMFETSDQNGRLIEEFSKAAPHPVANSLAYEIYRLLPNDTDLTIFKDANLPGLNFAFIDKSTHYHTQLDTSDEIDANSVQHHGNYALALTKHFGNLDLVNLKERNAVYFDVLGLFLVRYSGAFVPFITLLVTVIFLGLVVLGWRKGRFSLLGIVLALAVQLATLIVVPAGLALIWFVMQRLLNAFGASAQAAAYQSKLYFSGFALVAIAISYIACAALLPKIRVENFMAGSLGLWILLLIVTSLLLPGVTYMLTWPVFFCLPAFAYLVLTGEQKSNRLLPIVFFTLAVTPALLLLAPAVYVMSIGLNLSSLGTILAILILVCVLLVPHLLSLRLGNDRVFAIVIALAGVLLISVAAFRSTHDARHPKLDSLFYGLNADTGKAIWATFDDRPDEWTSRVLPSNAQRRAAPEFFAPGRAGSLLQADAAPAPLPAPNVTVLSDGTKDTSRTLKLRVTSSRAAPVTSVYIDSAKNLQAAWVNGRRIELAASGQRRSSWSINYHNALPEGMELTLEFSAEEPLKMRVVDQSYSLPELSQSALGSRPAGIIPSPVVYNDATVVSKSFSY
ncbi:MAG TPA: M28 family metallopeptidase [Pyrinomonadaceae bacterium]|nr:M28 family metallopeptidase [Pyrinomonadaceae bacterium]